MPGTEPDRPAPADGIDVRPGGPGSGNPAVAVLLLGVVAVIGLVIIILRFAG